MLLDYGSGAALLRTPIMGPRGNGWCCRGLVGRVGGIGQDEDTAFQDKGTPTAAVRKTEVTEGCGWGK